MSAPIEPVAPSGMEIIFVYKCPHCQNELGLAAPTEPAMVRCGYCQKTFPLLPVDERSVQYIRLMMGNGTAAVDIDYL